MLREAAGTIQASARDSLSPLRLAARDQCYSVAAASKGLPPTTGGPTEGRPAAPGSARCPQPGPHPPPTPCQPRYAAKSNRQTERSSETEAKRAPSGRKRTPHTWSVWSLQVCGQVGWRGGRGGQGAATLGVCARLHAGVLGGRAGGRRAPDSFAPCGPSTPLAVQRIARHAQPGARRGARQGLSPARRCASAGPTASPCCRCCRWQRRRRSGAPPRSAPTTRGLRKGMCRTVVSVEGRQVDGWLLGHQGGHASGCPRRAACARAVAVGRQRARGRQAGRQAIQCHAPEEAPTSSPCAAALPCECCANSRPGCTQAASAPEKASTSSPCAASYRCACASSQAVSTCLESAAGWERADGAEQGDGATGGSTCSESAQGLEGAQWQRPHTAGGAPGRQARTARAGPLRQQGAPTWREAEASCRPQHPPAAATAVLAPLANPAPNKPAPQAPTGLKWLPHTPVPRPLRLPHSTHAHQQVGAHLA